MKLLSHTLCLCLALALSSAAPAHHDVKMADQPEAAPQPEEDAHHSAQLDRCDGIEFDAIAPDEKGNTFFFKGDHLWKGFQGPAQLSNGSFRELDDFHHLGHVDAAFRMHHHDDLEDHDHIFFFLADKVFSYYNHTLEKGYPVDIQQEFPGVPSYLDAAVECPKGECSTDSVIFFKGEEVYHYDIKTKSVKKRVWENMPNCTSVFRWLEHYYCFHGHNFTRFHPVNGAVVGSYPKDARAYFMRCPNFGHGYSHRKPRCSDVRLDAITSDDSGKTYAFMGKQYMRLDSQRDGKHTFPITRSWKEVSDGVDAAFSYGDNIYMIKGDQVYIYKSAAHYNLIEGYPKPLKEELGIEGPVDAAFVCADHHIVHITQGQKMYDIDLSATPRTVKGDAILPFPKIDAGMCGPDGIRVYVRSEFFHYESPKLLAFSRIRPRPLKISPEEFVCEE